MSLRAWGGGLLTTVRCKALAGVGSERSEPRAARDRGRRGPGVVAGCTLVEAPAPKSEAFCGNVLPFPATLHSLSGIPGGFSIPDVERVRVSVGAAAVQQRQQAAVQQPRPGASISRPSTAAVRARRRQRLGASTAAAGAGAAEAGAVERQGVAPPAQRKATRRLTAEQEQALSAVVARGGTDAAAAVVALVDANRPLVHHLVRRFIGRGVDRQDLVAEGCMALERAAAAFRPGGEARFATYAAAFVWRAVQRAIHNHSRVVRLPCHQYHDMGRVKRATDELRLELGGAEPGCQAMAQRCGFTLRYTAHLLRAMAGEKFVPTAGATPGSLTAAELSMEAVVDDEECELQEQGEAVQAELHSCMQGLTPKQREVVTLRWGLLDGRRRTFKEVGDVLGFTASWASSQYQVAETRLRALMTSDGDAPLEAPEAPAADSVAVSAAWAVAARDAVAAALPRLSAQAQLLLALRHGWLDGSEAMPSYGAMAARLNRSPAWVGTHLRQAEAELMAAVQTQARQGSMGGASGHAQHGQQAQRTQPRLEPSQLRQVAPFGAQQRHEWAHALETLAATNAADPRRSYASHKQSSGPASPAGAAQAKVAARGAAAGVVGAAPAAGGSSSKGGKGVKGGKGGGAVHDLSAYSRLEGIAALGGGLAGSSPGHELAMA